MGAAARLLGDAPRADAARAGIAKLERFGCNRPYCINTLAYEVSAAAAEWALRTGNAPACFEDGATERLCVRAVRALTLLAMSDKPLLPWRSRLPWRSSAAAELVTSVLPGLAASLDKPARRARLCALAQFSMDDERVTSSVGGPEGHLSFENSCLVVTYESVGSGGAAAAHRFGVAIAILCAPMVLPAMALFGFLDSLGALQILRAATLAFGGLIGRGAAEW